MFLPGRGGSTGGTVVPTEIPQVSYDGFIMRSRGALKPLAPGWDPRRNNPPCAHRAGRMGHELRVRYPEKKLQLKTAVSGHWRNSNDDTTHPRFHDDAIHRLSMWRSTFGDPPRRSGAGPSASKGPTSSDRWSDKEIPHAHATKKETTSSCWCQANSTTQNTQHSPVECRRGAKEET